MDIKSLLSPFLSRKFLAPIVALFCFMVWKAWLAMIPIEIFATFMGALFGAFITVEGIKDIIVALATTPKK